MRWPNLPHIELSINLATALFPGLPATLSWLRWKPSCWKYCCKWFCCCCGVWQWEGKSLASSQLEPGIKVVFEEPYPSLGNCHTSWIFKIRYPICRALFNSGVHQVPVRMRWLAVWLQIQSLCGVVRRFALPRTFGIVERSVYPRIGKEWRGERGLGKSNFHLTNTSKRNVKHQR